MQKVNKFKKSQNLSFDELGLSLALLATLAFIMPIALISLAQFASVSISPSLLLAGLLLAVLLSFFLDADYRLTALSFFVLALVATLGALLFYGTIDLSHDSLVYHMRAILDFSKGYNPLKEVHEVPWIAHYPKGIWQIQAGIFQISGKMATTSLINLVAMLVAFGVALSFSVRSPEFSKGAKVVVVMASIFAPIPVVQASTHMVDGLFGSFAIAAIWLAVGLLQSKYKPKDKRLLVLIGGILLVLSSIKFTGFVFAGLLLLFMTVALVFYKKEFSLVQVGVYWSVLLLGLILIGFSPYVVNLAQHKNPFYPILSKDLSALPDAPDERQRPNAYREVNPVTGLFMSITEASKPMSKATSYFPKAPYVVTKAELKEIGLPDTPIGGNGPLFFLSLIFAGGLFGYYLIFSKDSQEEKLLRTGIVLVFLVLSFAMLETWWTRLVPFFSLAPVLLFALSQSDDLSNRAWFNVVVGLSILINLSLVGNGALRVHMEMRDNKEALTQLLNVESPKYFRFDPDCAERTKPGLRHLMSEFDSQAKELEAKMPVGSFGFVHPETQEKVIGFIFDDDPDKGGSDIQKVWLHEPLLGSLFYFSER